MVPFTWIGMFLFVVIGLPIAGIICGWIIARDDIMDEDDKTDEMSKYNSDEGAHEHATPYDPKCLSCKYYCDATGIQIWCDKLGIGESMPVKSCEYYKNKK